MEQYFPFRWTNPSQVLRFQVSRENTTTNRGLFYLCLLALGLFDDAEVKINDILGEGDNTTFYRRNLKGLRNYIKGMIPLYFPDEFKSHFRLTSELFTRAVRLTFHVAHMYLRTTH